jgi:hypothetical protein
MAEAVPASRSAINSAIAVITAAMTAVVRRSL